MRAGWCAPLALLALATVAADAASAAEIAPDARRSDTAAMTPAVRAMQADDAANPGMLAVLDGEALWSAAPANGKPSCAGCHGDAATTMRGVAARFPAWNAAHGAAVDLGAQVSICRESRQDQPALAPESPDLLALTAFVAHQSRGLPITPAPDAAMNAVRARGRALFTARIGQLNLSCAQCHDERWGGSLGGTAIPQGQPVGYPIYRLEWQAVGSIQRRLRNCMAGVRAEPLPFGAPDAVALEAYLMERAAGLSIETPAVRP